MDEALSTFIDRRERASLRSFASRLSVSEAELERRAIELMNETLDFAEVREMLNVLEAVEPGTMTFAVPKKTRQALNLPLKTIEDYFVVSRANARFEQRLAAQVLVDALQRGATNRIDYATVDRLARLSGAPGDPRSLQALFYILISLPSLSTFSSTFDAAVRLELETGGWPMITYHKGLSSVLTAFAQVWSCAFDRHPIDGMFSVRPSFMLGGVDRLREFVPAICDLTVIASEMQSSARAKMRSAHEIRERRAIWSAVFTGATLFVWLHEISHLLCGHFNRHLDEIDAEIEADQSALEYLFRQQVVGETALVAVGVDLAIYAIQLLAMARRDADTGNHPIPPRRLAIAQECYQRCMGTDIFREYQEMRGGMVPFEVAAVHLMAGESASLDESIVSGSPLVNPITTRGVPVAMFGRWRPKAELRLAWWEIAVAFVIGEKGRSLRLDVAKRCWRWIREAIEKSLGPLHGDGDRSFLCTVIVHDEGRSVAFDLGGRSCRDLMDAVGVLEEACERTNPTEEASVIGHGLTCRLVDSEQVRRSLEGYERVV